VQKFPEGLELESRPCPIGCKSDDEPVLEGSDRIHRIPGVFQIVRCRACGLMRTNPRPTPSTIGVYYPDDYGPYASTDAPPPPTASPTKMRLRRALGLETRRVPPVKPGRLLELGCASGSYLEEMRRAGWKVEGVEYSDTAARRARAKGFEVQTSTVESAVVSPGSVDLVAAWMVLEHLHDPVGALRNIREWARPDGYLAVSIPVHGGLFLRLFGNASYDLHLPNHLYHFSSRSIRQLMERAGWTVEKIFWQRNANTLLCTLEYTSEERGWKRTNALVKWLRNANSAGKLRVLLGWILGLTRASGRVEIWARPTIAK